MTDRQPIKRRQALDEQAWLEAETLRIRATEAEQRGLDPSERRELWRKQRKKDWHEQRKKANLPESSDGAREAAMGLPRTCDRCGHTSIPAKQRPGWRAIRENNVAVWICPDCSRKEGRA